METAFPSIQFNWNEGIVSGGIVRLIDLSKLDSMTLSSQSLTDFPQGLSMFGLRILPTLPQPRRPSYRLQAQILVAFQVYNEILPYMQKAGDTWDISPQIFFGFSAKF